MPQFSWIVSMYASRLTFESRARATESKPIRREGVWWRGAFAASLAISSLTMDYKKISYQLKNDRRTVETSLCFNVFSTQLQQQVKRSARVNSDNSLLTFCTRSQRTVGSLYSTHRNLIYKFSIVIGSPGAKLLLITSLSQGRIQKIQTEGAESSPPPHTPELKLFFRDMQQTAWWARIRDAK